jgi:transporter family protein
MPAWIIYALVSMCFAGFTAVIAKRGLADIPAELGLLIRTAFVFLFVVMITLGSVPAKAVGEVKRETVLWLALSALTTAGSWLFYYRALKVGEVSTIALIDKGSVIVAVLLAALFLKESITLRTVVGGVLMIAGLVIIAKK